MNLPKENLPKETCSPCSGISVKKESLVAADMRPHRGSSMAVSPPFGPTRLDGRYPDTLMQS
jgi:hypothetical protein